MASYLLVRDWSAKGTLLLNACNPPTFAAGKAGQSERKWPSIPFFCADCLRSRIFLPPNAGYRSRRDPPLPFGRRTRLHTGRATERHCPGALGTHQTFTDQLDRRFGDPAGRKSRRYLRPPAGYAPAVAYRHGQRIAKQLYRHLADAILAASGRRDAGVGAWAGPYRRARAGGELRSGSWRSLPSTCSGASPVPSCVSSTEQAGRRGRNTHRFSGLTTGSRLPDRNDTARSLAHPYPLGATWPHLRMAANTAGAGPLRPHALGDGCRDLRRPPSKPPPSPCLQKRKEAPQPPRYHQLRPLPLASKGL